MDQKTPPDQTPNTKEPAKKPPERKSGGTMWYFVALVLGTLLLLSWFYGDRKDELPYLKFVELLKKMEEQQVGGKVIPTVRNETAQAEPVEAATDPASSPSTDGVAPSEFGPTTAAGKPGDPERVFVYVTKGEGSEREEFQYWAPTNVRVSEYEVVGKIMRKQVYPEQGPEDLPDQVEFKSPRRGFENDDGRLQNLLEAAGVNDASGADPPSGWRYWAPMLFVTMIFIVIFLFMMRRLGGAGSPMAFGRSRGKLFAQEDIGITFDDVAGINEAVDEVREIVEFLRTPEKYQVLGGRIPKGVLLVGPPGTGKTLLAKAIAGEAGVPFFSLSGSDFVEMFVGVGAARVRDTFQQAENRAPCIIFIDELDALGKTRGSGMVGGHDEREQTLNALLVEMDGFSTNAGIIVIGATNRPETLDPALLRPGRFDRNVLVDRPDIRGREDILKVHVKNVKLGEGVNLKDVAGITPGFCGADLANLVNEAALLAARKGKTAVGMEEFNEGVERVMAGLEKKQRVMRADEKQRVAYHEAGHALVAYSLPNTDPVHKVSIIPRGFGALGYTLQRPEDDRYLMTKSELESMIQVLMGGTIAEEIIYDDISTGAQNDLERASDIARGMVMEYGMSRLGRVNYRESKRPLFLQGGDGEAAVGRRGHSEQTMREIDQEVRRIIDASIEAVRHILNVRRAALEALTQALIEKEVIAAAELQEIIDASSPGPLVVPGTDGERKRHAPALAISHEADQAEGQA